MIYDIRHCEAILNLKPDLFMINDI